MPDANGQFKGQGWSRRKQISWERIFASKKKGVHKYTRPVVKPSPPRKDG